MNKESFLKELSERLQVLNEQERQDLLEEYEQHIDLKIENGLSEEEAVRDFGTPEQLCEELLDVYHINSEYASSAAAQVQEEEKPISKTASALKRVCRIGGTENSEKKKLFDSIPVFSQKKESEADGIKSEEEQARELEVKRVHEEEREMRRQEKQMQHEEKLLKRQQKQKQRAERAAAFREAARQKKLMRKEQRIQNGGSWMMRVMKKTGFLLRTICRICWKISLFGVAFPFLMLALFALFCTGVVAVLLQQGYPLVGITLLGLGTFLGASGLSGLILSCVFHGKRSKER